MVTNIFLLLVKSIDVEFELRTTEE